MEVLVATTDSELYAYDIDDLFGKWAKTNVVHQLDACGSERSVAERLGWAASRVRFVLKSETRPDLKGAPILAHSIASLGGESYVQTKARFGRAVIHAFRRLEPDMHYREIARFFRLDDRTVRRALLELAD